MSYIELPLRVFRTYFPELAAPIPPFFDIDTRYVIRMDSKSRAIELGYPEDEWVIK